MPPFFKFNTYLMRFIFVLVVAMLAANSNYAQNPAYKNTSLSIKQRIEDLLGRMTVDEKVGQLNQLNGGVLTGPEAANDPGQKGKMQLVKAGKIGSFLNVIGVKEIKAVQKIAVEESRLGIPILFAYDVIHGYKTIFPIPLAEACSWDPKGAELTASIAAKESAAAGLHWTFAPMMDVGRDPRWGRVMEGSGEDPYLGSILAAARVKGFQGDLSDNQHILACVKHFAAYGAAEAGREYNTVDLSRYALWNYYLPPYQAAVNAGAATVMNSFNIFDGVPASANKYLVTDVLKKKWDFKGFVVSDWSSFGETITHGYAANKAEAAEKCMLAGSDMDMESRVFTEELAKLVNNGAVSTARLDDAVGRILYYKFKLGLFEDPYRFCDEEREKRTLLAKEHLAIARTAAANSMILLKNQGNVLPLAKTTKNILVTGFLADSKPDVLDFWKGQGDDNNTVTVLAGLKNKLPNANISYAKGYEDGNKTNEVLLKELSKKAAGADVVVAVIGVSGKTTGEARCLADIAPTADQMQMLRTLKQSGKPVVVVVQTGRPMVLTEVDQNFSTILYAWIGGTEHGNGLADVLLGDVNPTAKTAMTFPYAVGQIPVYYNHYNTGRPHTDGKNGPDDFWVSRYRDIPNSPLYPFGFGLSYTTYDYSNLKLSKTNLTKNETVEVSIEVKNTGKVAGQEIVQLYIQDPYASRVRPVKELKDFQKISLNPGESKVVTFQLPATKLGFLDENGDSLLETGAYKIMVGKDSENLLKADLMLK